MNRQIISLSLLLVTMLFASIGCSALNTSNEKLANSLDIRRAMWWKSDQPEPQLPVRLVSTWTDTVLHKPGQKSLRGFGGRLVFFGRESDDPVNVDGQLVVYAYDEAESDSRTAEPTRRFIFPREQFKRHYSESSLGPTYSVWLPWDEVGGPRRNISLIARFEPHQGQLIAGEQTRHMLPGTAPPEIIPGELPSTRKVQLAQHTTATGSGSQTVISPTEGLSAPSREMTTTSIRVSDRWRDRLASRPRSGSRTKRSPSSTIQKPVPPATPAAALPENSPPPTPQ